MVINTATAVVTGCSSGIGYETVRVLLANGYQVFGSVRSQSAAGRLASEFGPRFTPLCFDTTDVTAVLAAAEQVRSQAQFWMTESLGARSLSLSSLRWT